MSITGTAEFTFNGTLYQTWYEIFGDLNGIGKRPLVALHGGPGMTHHYMLPHKILYEKAGIPVVVYDGIGNGKSSPDMDETKEFWSSEIFMVQLDSLLRHLGISSDFDLLGHSWGGMVSASYAAIMQPTGLKRLIVVDSPADMIKFAEGTKALFEEHFPKELVDRFNELYAAGQGHSDEYQQILMQFSRKFVTATDPWPQEGIESMKSIRENGKVHHALMGTSILHVDGNLKDWSIVADLPKIRAPLLLISSPNDMVQESAIIPYFLHTPKAKWVELPTTTHSPMSEDPEKYFAAILAFLKYVK